MTYYDIRKLMYINLYILCIVNYSVTVSVNLFYKLYESPCLYLIAMEAASQILRVAWYKGSDEMQGE
jgi:hypothetical protein